MPLTTPVPFKSHGRGGRGLLQVGWNAETSPGRSRFATKSSPLPITLASFEAGRSTSSRRKNTAISGSSNSTIRVAAPNSRSGGCDGNSPLEAAEDGDERKIALGSGFRFQSSGTDELV